MIDSVSQLTGIRLIRPDGTEEELAGEVSKDVLMSGEALDFARYIRDPETYRRLTTPIPAWPLRYAGLCRKCGAARAFASQRRWKAFDALFSCSGGEKLLRFPAVLGMMGGRRRTARYAKDLGGGLWNANGGKTL